MIQKVFTSLHIGTGLYIGGSSGLFMGKVLWSKNYVKGNNK